MEVEDGSQGNDIGGEVNESLGLDGDGAQAHEPEPEQSKEHSHESLSVQKRLKAQKRAHEREVRDLHQQIGALESRMSQPMQSQNQMPQQMQQMQQDPQSQNQNQQMPQGMGQPQQQGMEDPVHRAVNLALQQRDMQERKALENQQMAHVNRQYQDLHRHLDKMGDKYDDFHDVVMGHDAPYTPAMRDYSLTLPRNGAGSAGEVLYKLGKNPEELSRIARLHPLDQASEMAKLSHALVSGGESKGNAMKAPLGNIKSNPVVNNASISDKTPISELRARMKANWK